MNKVNQMKSKTLISIFIIGLAVAITSCFIAFAATDAPHNESNNIDCGSCHGVGLLNSPFWGGTMSYDQLCLNCHKVSSGPYSETNAPLAETHSSQTTSDKYSEWERECRNCHNPHYQRQKLYKNTDANNLYLATGSITNCVYNGDNTSTLTYSTITYKTGWDATRLTEKTSGYRRTILFPNVNKLGYNYPIIAVDSDAKTIKVTGNATTIIYPPTTFAAMYGQYIKDFIDVGGTNKQVKFFDQTGTNSYADGDTIYNGICDVCHTQTDHFRNNGGAPDQDHANVCEAKGTNCITCHKHSNGLGHGGGGSETNCVDCHGHDDGWNGGTYYGTTFSHSTHTENDSDDLKGPFITCDTCHDTNIFPCFKSGTDSNGDGRYDLSETDVCDNCHSPGGAFDGVQMAKDSWHEGVYASPTLRAGKEKWCAGCHDDQPAYSRSVLNQGIVDNGEATYVGTWPVSSTDPNDPAQFYGADVNYHAAGTGANTATWNFPAGLTSGTYNVYARWTIYSNRATNAYYTINHSGGADVVGPINMRRDGGTWKLLGSFDFTAGSGSVVLNDNADGIVIADAIWFLKSDSVGTYAPNVVGDNSTYGFYISGHKMNCLACHDQRKAHIDHEHRTYEVDEATSTAVNTYEAGYRLKEIGGERPMVIPQAANNCTRTPSFYLLCFKCHDSEPLLSYTRSGTNMWKEATQLNYHRAHLDMKTSRTWDSDWDAIMGNPVNESIDSVLSCPACHNVHGSPTPAMTRHGELMTIPGSPSKVPSFNIGYLNDIASRDPSITTAFPDSVGLAVTLGGHPESNNHNGICGHCHSGSFYIYRPPVDVPKPVNPKVLLPRPVPSNIVNDGASPVLLTVVAVDPNGGLTSVEIDLSSVGGSATQAMYDDGTHGDITAADDTYSYLLSGTTVGVGNKTLAITAEDSDNNTATDEITLAVHNEAGSYIVDNTEAVFTLCEWASWSTSTTFFGKDFQYIGAGSGNHTATWNVPSDMPGGTYNVYVQWSSYTNRATNVYYTVNRSGGSDVVGPFDQKANGGTWVLLGTFSFDGGDGSVVVTDNVNGVLTADAIKWEPQP
jgi:hypothetical protein